MQTFVPGMTSHPTNRFAATPPRTGLLLSFSLCSLLFFLPYVRSRPFESRSLARGWKGEHSEKIPGYRLRFICFRIRGRGNQDSRLNIAREVHTRKIIQKEKYNNVVSSHLMVIFIALARASPYLVMSVAFRAYRRSLLTSCGAPDIEIVL